MTDPRIYDYNLYRSLQKELQEMGINITEHSGTDMRSGAVADISDTAILTARQNARANIGIIHSHASSDYITDNLRLLASVLLETAAVKDSESGPTIPKTPHSSWTPKIIS